VAEPYPAVSLAHAALSCRCPRCGEGAIFAGLLTVRPACLACGLDLSGEDAGDGPAVFLIFFLGALAVGIAAAMEIEFEPPIWVHLLVLTPIIVGGAIGLLRPMKAYMIALQYRHNLLKPPQSWDR
jgi:uncharacterized protein (DUF983 family)